MSIGLLEITAIFVILLICVCACVGAFVIARRLITAIARRTRR